MFKKSLSIVVVLLFANTSFSSMKGHHMGSEKGLRDRDTQKRGVLNKRTGEGTPILVSWSGVIQSDGVGEFSFQRKSGKRFDVIESAKLDEMNWKKGQRFEVNVSGKLTDKFLFWGGDLMISELQVVKELEPIKFTERPSFSDRRHGPSERP